MGRFDPFIRVVTNMMNLFGTDATVLVAGDGVYNAATSSFTASDTPYPVRVITFDLTKLNNGERSIPNTLIQEGDKQVYIQPVVGLDPSATLPAIQQNKDRLILNGITYKIVVLKQVNTTMANLIVYEAYCRI